MKKNLKVGDKVRINLSANYDGPCTINYDMRAYDTREAKIKSITDSLDGSNRYKLDVDSGSSFYVAEWLDPVVGSIAIPIDDWKRIYDVACEDWKKKLYEKVEPFAKDVTIDEEFAASMIKASNTGQRKVVRDVLSSSGYSQKNIETYFEFEGGTFAIGERSSNVPMYIRFGLASCSDMERREIGFGTDSFEVILVEGGEARTLSKGSYLKFKKK